MHAYVPCTLAAVVEWLACRTEIAGAFGKIRETLGTVERDVLAQSAVGVRIYGVMLRSIDHCRNSPLPYVASATKRALVLATWRIWRSCLGQPPSPGSCAPPSLDSHNHTTLIVDQVIVVLTQPGRSSTLGRVGCIRIGGRHQLLLMHRLFGGVLLLNFHSILTHDLVQFCCICYLLA